MRDLTAKRVFETKTPGIHVSMQTVSKRAAGVSVVYRELQLGQKCG